jgi:hypothetical protein
VIEPKATPPPPPSTPPPPPPETQPFDDGDLGDAAYGDKEGEGGPSAPAGTDTDAAEPETPMPLAADARGATQTVPRAAITLGVGKERLTASGAVSEYEGEANIGGVGVRAEFPVGAAWLGVAQVGAHNFTTTVTRRDEATGTETEADSKFLRLSARAGVFYDLGATPDGPSSVTWGPGIGLAMFRLPVLEIADEATGAADLEPRDVIGPSLGVYFARHLSHQTSVGADVATLPLSLVSDAKGMSTSALLFWRNAFVARLFTEIALLWSRETATVDVDCPAVEGCAGESTAKSDSLAAKLGIGMIF